MSLSGPGTNTSHSLAQEHHEAICDGAEDPGVQVLKSDSWDYRLAYPGDPKVNFSLRMGWTSHLGCLGAVASGGDPRAAVSSGDSGSVTPDERGVPV